MSKRRNNRTQTAVKFSKTLLDIIILVMGRFDLVKQCLDAIPDAAGDVGYRIIIYDNASPKEEADTFYAQYPDIKVIRSKTNIGFPKGCNAAVKHGFSPLLFFLNDDVILKPNSINLMVKELDDPKIGVVGMKLVFPEYTDLPQSHNVRPPGKLQHIGLCSDIHGDFVHQFIGWSPDHPKVNAVRDMYAVTGAALMTRRRLFQNAGGFLEAYGLGTWEDVDFCLTIREMGYDVIVVPQAEGVHHTSATLITSGLKYPMSENKIIFLQRWSKKLDWTSWIYD
jgi:GT2 family glycosyltransferase